MAILFSKTYSGKIKRAISEGLISPSALPEAYIKKESNTTINTENIESKYPARIFSIIPKSKSVEVTTNTLGIKITDIVDASGKPYYKFLTTSVSNSRVLTKLDTYTYNGVTYVNTDKDYIQDGDNLIFLKDVQSLNLWDRSPNISIRRLKDRFKITIKTDTPEKLTIDLKVKSIFTPSIRNNWMSFYDCVYNTIDNKPAYLYTHSFEYYDKVEIHENSTGVSLRDIPISNIEIQTIDENYKKISYKTYRSNLYINLELLNNSHISIVRVNEQSNLNITRDLSAANINLFKITKTETLLKELELNPYLSTDLYKGRAEKLYFVWETTTKYAHDFNVPFGCERVELDFNKILKREKETLRIGGRIITEDNIPTQSNTNYVTSQYLGKTDLDKLLTFITI